MDPNYVRDEENEDVIMQQIYEDANPIDPDREDAGGEDDDFASQFMMDSGEGLESEERRAGEVYILRLFC